MLSRADVEEAFRDIGELLLRAGKTAEIAVYRSAAIMLHFDVAFRAADVDAHVESGDHGALMQAAHEVAWRRGWLRSWLSEAVTVYLGAPGGTTLYRAYPDDGRAALRVYLAKPDPAYALSSASRQWYIS